MFLRRPTPFTRLLRYRTYTATTSARFSLPDLLPFLEKHASTPPELQLRDVLRNQPNDNASWKEQAKKAYIDASYYDYALDLESDDYERGRLHMLLNQPNAAKHCYDRAHQAAPNHPRILISLAAWEYRQRQDCDAALEYLHRSMDAVDDDDAMRLEILKYQGMIHRSKGDFKEALSIYKSAVTAGATEFLLDVADMHAALEDWSAACDEYQKLLEDWTDDDAMRAVLLHNLAKCHAQDEYFQIDNGDAAIQYGQESLALKRRLKSDDSEVAKTLNLLGVLFARRNDKPKALLRFQEALLLARSGDDSEDNPLVLHAMRNIAVLKGQKIPKWSG